MRNLILMTKQKASRLDEAELAAEIEKLSTDFKAKLRLRDEQRRPVDLTPMIVAVLKHELATRQAKKRRAEAQGSFGPEQVTRKEP